MAREKGALQMNFLITAELMDRIEEYWHIERYGSKSEAVRALLEKALTLYEQGEQRLKK